MKNTKITLPAPKFKNDSNSIKNDLSVQAIVVLILSTMFLSVLPMTRVAASGIVSGTVYVDYNMNGDMDTSGAAPNYAIDGGFGPVTVTVFAPNGASKSAVADAVTGLYSIDTSAAPALPDGPYRVEFSNLPTSYFPSSVGSNNDTSVQFVPNGDSSNVDFGIVSQKEYCQNNPDLVVNCYIDGDTADGDVLLNFPYSAGAPTTTTTQGPYENPTTHSMVVNQSQIGPTWGLAYSRIRKRIYAASYFKKHTNFGPDGPDAIYVVNPEDSSVTDTFSVPGATTDSHGTTNVCAGTPSVSDCDNGNTGWDAVGKTALGGLDISDDETSIYVMNLQNRTLYEMDAVSGLVTRLQSVPGVPNVAGSVNNLSAASNLPPGAAGSAVNVRPFAVKNLGGKIYVGVVTSAETTPATLGNLQAHVYEVEPSTFAFTLRLSIPLNYNRGAIIRRVSNGDSSPAEWNAWRTTFATVGSLDTGLPAEEIGYPQPILTGIDFDNSGNLVLGIRDRAGDQLGHFVNSDPDVAELFIGESAGDTLKACGNQTSGWTIESNARCGGEGNGPQGNGQGIGNGEFFHADGYSDNGFQHDETSLGGLEQLAGRPNIAMTVYDPANIADGTAAFSAGAKWYVNNQGDADRSYIVYQSPGGGADENFAKANGLGDIIALCDSAPLQVGNRVWEDTNSNGVQDPGEASISGVNLQLWADTDDDGTVDTQVGTATSDGTGNYIFGGISNQNLGTFSCGTTSATVNGKVNAASDDAVQNADSSVTINGVRTQIGGAVDATGVRFTNLNIPQGATITNAYIQFYPNNVTNVNTGTPVVTIRGNDVDNAATFAATNNNVTGRADTTASQTWTITPTWTNNGAPTLDHRTPDISSVVQEIVDRGGWSSGNAMAFTLEGSGTTSRRDAEAFGGTPADAPEIVVEYSVPGICSYELEPNTAYEVRIPESNYTGALSGFTPTVPNNDGSANGDTRDSDGLILSGNALVAPFVTGGNGNNNHSYDFGFVSGSTVYSLGNRLWFDTDNDGVIDPAEVGKSGASVTLLNSDGTVYDSDGNAGNGVQSLSVTTDADGYYRFDNLPAGNYRVRVDGSNFSPGGMIPGYRNTSGNNTGDVESSGASSNAENGINPADADDVLTDGIQSNVITLGPTEPLSEADVPSSGSFAGQGSLDNQADMTVDFGFYKLTLSGTVWADNGNGNPADNDDGELDAAENRLPGYTVRLFDSLGNEIPVGPDGILGTADDATGGMITDGSGNYNFMGMPAGDYRVILSPAGGASSTPSELNPNDNVDDNDNGFPDDTGNFAGMIISGIVTLTPGSTGAAGNNSVDNPTAQTSDPTIDFGLILSPTAVKLDKFNAYYKGNSVVVEWSTGDEAGNLGFNVYRQAKGQRQLLTNAPVAGSALRTTVDLKVKSNSYSWVDDQSEIGAVYYIEDLDLDGTRTMHGPISPQVKVNFGFNEKAPSKLLTGFTKPEVRSSQIEFVQKEASNSLSSENAFDSDRQREIAAMPGVKLHVNERGWYKVPFAQLEQAGFDVTSDSANWSLYANGVEVPISIRRNSYQNIHNVEFYGRGVDTKEADEQVYYLVKSDQPGLRLNEVKGGNSNGSPDATTYEMSVMRKDRSFYWSSLLNGEQENWFGPIITSGAESFQDFDLENPVDNGTDTARLTVRLQGLTGVAHLVNVSLNGVQIGSVSLSGRESEQAEFDVPMSSIVNGLNRVGLQSAASGSDYNLIDFVKIDYIRNYITSNDEIRFVVPANQAVEVSGFEESDVKVIEINNENAVREVGVDAYKVNGTAGIWLKAVPYERELLAINDFSQSRNVERIEANIPSSLNSTKNEADFVIVTPKLLKPQADILAARRKTQGLDTVVVDVSDIYDEYSFGIRSVAAIKDFLSDASSNWTVKPGYLLLFGDSSYDHRNYLNQQDRNLIPTKLVDTEFMETASDGWLGDFDNDGVEDISLGRLPVGTIAEADAVLAKLARYDAQEARTQKSNLLVSDNFFENYSSYLQGQLPEGVESTKLNRADLSDSQLRQDIVTGINDDPMVVTYTGHGTTGVWASAGVFRDTDVAGLSNSKLSFFMMMTCLNGFTHNAGSDSMAESLLKANNGAIAVWASSGSTYASGQIFMSVDMTGNAFSESQRIGDMIKAAKLSTNDPDARRTWQLIGDPTLFVK